MRQLYWQTIFWRLWAIALVYLVGGLGVLAWLGDTGWRPIVALVGEALLFGAVWYVVRRARRTAPTRKLLRRVGRTRWSTR